jgi:hypothetical protein
MKNVSKLIFTSMILLCLLIPVTLFGAQSETGRGGITFSFSDVHYAKVDEADCLEFNINVSGSDVADRIGTGIVLLNYNTESFGEFVFNNNNVIVTGGIALQTSPPAIYNVIVNDNKSDRLAITFEFTSTSGSGNFLTDNPQQLLNIKMKINAFGYSAGLSYAQLLMHDQQYLNDNITLFSPITANSVENGYLTTAPLNLILTNQAGILTLSWQEIPDCNYNVYSSDIPLGSTWQLEATVISETQWLITNPESHKFYRVTSQSNMERIQR